MKVGAYILATTQGLGIMAKQFFENGVIDYVAIHNHGSRKNHYEWYPHNLSEEELLEKSDVILFFETPFNWKLILKARELGKKTVLMPMHECTKNPLPYIPDLLLNNSDLEQQMYPSGIRVVTPVDEEWKLREKARIFIHNAGNGGLGGRNGTKELIEAMQWVKSPIKLIIRSQIPIKQIEDNRIEYRIGEVPHEELYKEGDIFIFPEKFNGCSMPIQEACASGMPIICGDRFPMNSWLPKELLIKVSGYKRERINAEFDSAIIDPKDIANKIDEWYDRDITGFSLLGKEWGENNSWKVWAKKYRNILENLCNQQNLQ
jgi:glycosyltransferase involved in cell wall biosynthesis